MLTTAGYPTTSMGITAVHTIKSLLEERNFSLDKSTPETGIGKDGKYYAYEGLAYILVVGLFAYVSKLVGIYPHGIYFTNQILTAIACLILFYIGRELKYSTMVSILLALIYGIGTMAWVHSRFLMPEPLTTLVYLAAFLFLLKYKKRKRADWLFLCGCFTGLAVIVRPDAPLFMFGMIVAVIWLIYVRCRDERKSWSAIVREGVLFLTPLVLFFGIYAYYNYARFGSVFELGYSTKAQLEVDSGESHSPVRVKSITGTLLGLAGMWVIPCRSMFFINPVLIFIFWALKDFWKRYRYEMIVMGVIFILHVLLYANRGPSGFPGSSAWGIRYMVPMTSFMVIVMGVFVEKTFSNRRRIRLLKIFTIIFIVSAVFQFVGTSNSYQVTQLYLQEHYKTPDDEWVARRMMNLDPRWNLITQNMKLILEGYTDLLYYNCMNQSKVNMAKYNWQEGVPAGVGTSMILFIVTVLTSGYFLLRFLLGPALNPQKKSKFEGMKKKRRKYTDLKM